MNTTPPGRPPADGPDGPDLRDSPAADGDGFSVRVDGREVRARRGQTVAAVLMEAGMRSWRTTRVGGRPRGLFCGIGVCFDCLVTLNGRPSVRACLVEPAPGDQVQAQEGTSHDQA